MYLSYIQLIASILRDWKINLVKDYPLKQNSTLISLIAWKVCLEIFLNKNIYRPVDLQPVNLQCK